MENSIQFLNQLFDSIELQDRLIALCNETGTALSAELVVEFAAQQGIVFTVEDLEVNFTQLPELWEKVKVALDNRYSSERELSDFELDLISGMKGERYSYTARVCEFMNRTGGGTLTFDKYVVRTSCTCNDLVLNYGTPNDRGIQTVQLTESEFNTIYRSINCESIKIYS